MGPLGPRLVVAGTGVRAGKTTITTGLLAALRSRGDRVASAKVGPDFIDPGYHALATRRPGRNLDPWMSGAAAIPALAAGAATGADLLVVEGVMGLFDGASFVPDELDADRAALPTHVDLASTAHVAMLLDAPVLLVVDAGAMSGSVAALVHGFASLAPEVRVAGVLLNRVGSDSHEAMLRRALEPLEIPVLGALHRDDALVWRDRHLGLVPVVEHVEAVRMSIDRLARHLAARCDLDAIAAVARAAPVRTVDPLPTARPQGRPRLAVARGPAFSFTYPDNDERLVQAGAELVPFDPATDRALPAGCSGLVAGGGFPEVFAGELAANAPLLADVRARVRGGLVTWAECGGLLWLADSLDGHAMAGAVPTSAAMGDRLALGYRHARVRAANPIASAGAVLRGHEFHYSRTDPGGDALELRGRTGTAVEGFATSSLLATYLHLHLGADPAPAERFVAACTAADPADRRDPATTEGART